MRCVVLVWLFGCSYHVPPGGAVDDGSVADTSPPTDSDVITDAPDPDGPTAPQIVTLGLIQDLDADRDVTGTTSVTAWANQVAGAGEDVVATPAGLGAIVLVENAINGHAALQFADNARMEGNNTTVFRPLTSGDGLTWFAVVEAAPTQDTNDRNQMFGTIQNGGVNSGFTAGFDRAAKPYAMIRPLSTESKAQSPTATSQWSVLAGRLTDGLAAQVTVYRNSSTPDAITNVTVPANPGTVGALTIASERDDGTEFFEGKLARILIYSRPLTDLELATTGQALSMQYAIATAF